MVEVNLDTITAGESVDVWHPICPTKGCMNPKGELHLVVTWEPLEEQTPGLVARTAAPGRGAAARPPPGPAVRWWRVPLPEGGRLYHGRSAGTNHGM